MESSNASPSSAKDYALKISLDDEGNEIGFVPCSRLDNVLVLQDGEDVRHSFHSFLDGAIVDENNVAEFNKTIVNMVEKKEYTHTDHLITRIVVGPAGVNFYYVSLDNSRRANGCGFPLRDRLDNICDTVNVLLSAHDGGIVVFSEACRKSFSIDKDDGTTKDTTWFEMRRTIENRCNLVHLAEIENNTGPEKMSFGLAAFVTRGHYDSIYEIYPQRLIEDGFGSVAMGIKLKNANGIVWAIHFPLDFKNTEYEDNHNVKATKALVEIMRRYSPCCCAFGDFNTIPGMLNDYMEKALAEKNARFLNVTSKTFYGSFYDIAPIRDGISLISL